MPSTEVRVLGPIEVVGDAGGVPLADKQARLLAALVLADGQSRGVDELVEAIWEGSAPASARKLVQVYVSQLRKGLPAGIEIATQQGGYALSLEPDTLDSARFDGFSESRMRRSERNAALALSLVDRALALWRGRAYGELAYEDFAHAESERLEELRLGAIEARLAAQLELGRHAEVLAEALKHAEEHALRDRAHELVMLALYRCGRQADALDHYARFRTFLADELGLEPGQPLRELQRRILQQDSQLDVAAGAGARTALPAPPNPLVGRERELALLRDLLERRESRLIVLTGAGGSGKTRLGLELARQVAATYANGVVVVELAPLRDDTPCFPPSRTRSTSESKPTRTLSTPSSRRSARRSSSCSSTTRSTCATLLPRTPTSWHAFRGSRFSSRAGRSSTCPGSTSSRSPRSTRTPPSSSSRSAHARSDQGSCSSPTRGGRT